MKKREPKKLTIVISPTGDNEWDIVFCEGADVKARVTGLSADRWVMRELVHNLINQYLPDDSERIMASPACIAENVAESSDAGSKSECLEKLVEKILKLEEKLDKFEEGAKLRKFMENRWSCVDAYQRPPTPDERRGLYDPFKASMATSCDLRASEPDSPPDEVEG